tara:strand:- start:1874 stop:2776 length:903 start_codon:yes stop_codon:yes gene_type:complete
MNTSIAALKRSRSNLDALTKELSGVSSNNNQKSYVDDRFWKPELDKTGNGYAVLRFLPAVKDEDLPWVKMWSHAFQGPGGWYIENSLTTMNQKDPVSEENSRLWNSGIEADKDIARKRKRKLSYFANVLIVADPKHPENEGQVKLFKFGKKIFDKITDKMQPQFEDEKPVNPFDFWEGADFKLKIRKVDGFWNYDKSEFDSTKEIADNDEAIEGIWSKQYPLKPFLEAANFKSYDELKSKLDKVLTGSRNTGTVEDMVTPPSISETKPETVVEAVAASSSNDSVDDDETLSYFSKLAEEE